MMRIYGHNHILSIYRDFVLLSDRTPPKVDKNPSVLSITAQSKAVAHGSPAAA